MSLRRLRPEEAKLWASVLSTVRPGRGRVLRRHRTTLVIAHRLSTIRSATRILVLHDGRLADQGTHDELMASNALYRRMCALLSVGRSLDEAGLSLPADAVASTS